MTVIVDYVMVALLLGAALLQDITLNKISNKINVSGAVTGLALAVVLPHRGVLDAVLGVIACFACGLLCWNLKVFRAGDAKLFCALGAFMGWQLGLSCILYAVLIGSVIGLPLVIWKRVIQREKHMVKMPFSIAAAMASVLCYAVGTLWSIFPNVW